MDSILAGSRTTRKSVKSKRKVLSEMSLNKKNNQTDKNFWIKL